MKFLEYLTDPSPVPGVTRRRVLPSGGVTLVAAFAGCRSSTAVSVPSGSISARRRRRARSAASCGRISSTTPRSKPSASSSASTASRAATPSSSARRSSQEKALIAASRKSADLFATLRRDPDAETKALVEGQAIKSIIHPTLADHVRREAVKFVDELKRV